jgi:hypothetical protein
VDGEQELGLEEPKYWFLSAKDMLDMLAEDISHWTWMPDFAVDQSPDAVILGKIAKLLEESGRSVVDSH